MTLPIAPADKSRIAIKKIDSTTNVVTIQAGSGDVFNKAGGAISLTLSLQNQAMTLQYTSSTGIWYVMADDLPLSQLDSRYSSSINAATRVVDVRDYGVIADGTPHNNVANLLDAFAMASAAGAREILLPAGVIDTSDAVIGSVTANSGRAYTNNGGIPLPVNQAIRVTGHGKGVTTLRLSVGFTRAFDFWFAVSNQSYKNITLHDFTVDRNNILGTNIAPATAVTGGVTLTPNTWVTLPGISATTFRNAQYVFFPSTNTGTANTRMMPAQVSGTNFQVYNDGASATLVSGDLVQGSMQGHVICGTSCGVFRVASNMYIDSVLVENVDAINIACSSANGAGTVAPNRSSGILISVFNNAGLSPSSIPSVTNFRAKNVQLYGGSIGIVIQGENPNTFVDEIWFEDCFHDTLINPTTNWNSGNFMIGGYAWTNRVGMIRCHGRRSGDIAYEIDQPWEGRVEDCLWEEAYTGCYTTTFVPPARTIAGPPTTTLNNGGALTSGATSMTVTAIPASVARVGLALIDSELVWYVTGSGTTMTIVRGFNGSTAASHTDGATVTFVQFDKCKLWDVRSTVRNKDILATAGAGRAWAAYQSSGNLPFVPFAIRDPQVEFIGGTFQIGSMLYWNGWRPDLDIQGLNFTWDSLSQPSGSSHGSVMAWLWPAGTTILSTAPTSKMPRIFGRNNQMRIHGTMGAGNSLAGFQPGSGIAKLDFDLSYESFLTGSDVAANRAFDMDAVASTFYLAAGSRLGIKMRSSYSSAADFAPIGLVVGAGIYIVSLLDVDIDLSEMGFLDLGNSLDTEYFPWNIISAQLGRVRFNKIVHSQSATIQYPTRKHLTAAVSSNYTVKVGDEAVLVNTSSGAVTITLPLTTGASSGVGEPLSQGRELKIIDAGYNAATHNITITPAATDKINNGTAGASLTVNSNGAVKTIVAVPTMPGWIIY